MNLILSPEFFFKRFYSSMRGDNLYKIYKIMIIKRKFFSSKRSYIDPGTALLLVGGLMNIAPLVSYRKHDVGNKEKYPEFEEENKRLFKILKKNGQRKTMYMFD